MTAAEMQLMQECEYYRNRVAEFEKVEFVTNSIMDIIDNEKQRYSDIISRSHDDKAREVAQNKWESINDLQKEIEQKLERF